MKNSNLKKLNRERRDLFTDLVETLEKSEAIQSEDTKSTEEVITSSGETVTLGVTSKNKRN